MSSASPAEEARARRRNPRTCIVTREKDPAHGLIHFVAGPDGTVMPDIAEKLPGRGAWVGARHALVAKAAKGQMFSRAFKRQVQVPSNLGEIVADHLREHVVRTLPMLRKSGDLVSGAGKVDALVRAGEAALVLHAAEAAADGVRKIDQAIHAGHAEHGSRPAVSDLLTSEELGLAFGGDRVIHAAIRRSGGGITLAERLARFRDYLGTGADGQPPSTSRGKPPGSRRGSVDPPEERIGNDEDGGATP